MYIYIYTYGFNLDYLLCARHYALVCRCTYVYYMHLKFYPKCKTHLILSRVSSSYYYYIVCKAVHWVDYWRSKLKCVIFLVARWRLALTDVCVCTLYIRFFYHLPATTPFNQLLLYDDGGGVLFSDLLFCRVVKISGLFVIYLWINVRGGWGYRVL